MATQWNRLCNLILESPLKLSPILLTELRVTFSIDKQPSTRYPGFAGTFRIYNPSNDTANQLLDEEFTNIKLSVGYYGYQDEYGNYPDQTSGLIFDGGIRFARRGKDDAATTWVEIEAVSSWQANLSANINQTIGGGYTDSDLVDIAIEAMGQYGVSRGNIMQLSTTVYPRGRPLYLMARQLMDQVAQDNKAHWWIENDQLNLQPLDDINRSTNASTTIIELNSDTGLVGMPTQTQGAGVDVRCLINPNIKIGDTIRINQADIIRITLTANQFAGPQGGNSNGQLAEQEMDDGSLYVGPLAGDAVPSAINADGDYVVGYMKISGDTRGQDWYMDLMCLSKGARYDRASSSTINLADPSATAQQEASQ